VGSDSETAIQVVIADDKDGASAKVVAYDVKKLLEDGINGVCFASKKIDTNAIVIIRFAPKTASLFYLVCVDQLIDLKK